VMAGVTWWNFSIFASIGLDCSNEEIDL